MRIPLKGGDEEAYLTRARHFSAHKPGKAKAAKRSYARRFRKMLRAMLRKDPSQ